MGESIVSCLRILNNSVKEKSLFNLCRYKPEIGGARGTHRWTRVAYRFFCGEASCVLMFHKAALRTSL